MINNIFDFVGNTPIVPIKNNIDGLNIFAKLEFLNPTGSTKDRIVKYILDDAKAGGLINHNTTIVEGTSGNTGIAVAAYAAANGLKSIIIISNKMSQDKVDTIRAFGAQVIVVPADVPADDPSSYYEVARRISTETPNAFYVNQYHNKNNTKAHYNLTGKEIYEQITKSAKKIDAIFIGIGTSGTISGIGRYIKERLSHVKIIGVDTYGSILEQYFKQGSIPFADIKMYAVEGIGEDMIPANFDSSVIDDIIKVNDIESFEAARRITLENGIFAGGSSGSAVAAIEKYTKLHNLQWNVLTIFSDHGSRYLSKLYSDKWFSDFKNKNK